MDALNAAMQDPAMKGYTPMAAGNFEIANGANGAQDSPRMGGIDGDPNGEALAAVRKQMSDVAQKKADFAALVLESTQHPEYQELVDNASQGEDVPNDCWGALVFVIVNDFPDLRAGRATTETRARTAFVFILFLLNMFIQGVLLWYIGKLLMLPDILGAQNLYKSYHTVAFSNGVHDSVLFDAMPNDEQTHLCGMALSQGLFCRIILFLWVTVNVGELRDNAAKTVGALGLPRLPDGMDTRLMVRDLPLTEASGCCVVCLNMKGKVGLLVLVFIPKFTIAILLVLMGSMWLLAAESIGDLILNSLALAFVVRVDELLCVVFFPARFQSQLTNLCMMLPGDPEDKDDDKLMQKVVWEFGECAITVLVSLAIVEIMFIYQPVVPGYAFDVAAPCAAYLAKQVPWCFPWNRECFPTA